MNTTRKIKEGFSYVLADSSNLADNHGPSPIYNVANPPSDVATVTPSEIETAVRTFLTETTDQIQQVKGLKLNKP